MSSGGVASLGLWWPGCPRDRAYDLGKLARVLGPRVTLGAVLRQLCCQTWCAAECSIPRDPGDERTGHPTRVTLMRAERGSVSWRDSRSSHRRCNSEKPSSPQLDFPPFTRRDKESR